jgi:hypothetical protein
MTPLATLVLAAAATGATAPALRAERAAKPPIVDGRIDDAEWKKAPVSSSFTQKLPVDGEAPSEPTRVRVLYDDTTIYVAVECVQKTSNVVAPLTRRDRDVETDSVSVALATRGDGTTAFEFTINPAGVLADATRFDDTSYSRDWDGNWVGKATKTADGWSAELAIPLRILRFEEKPVQSFGMQVRRYTSGRKESDEWAHIPRSASGEVSKYGRLENLVGLKKGSSFEVRPFVLGKIGSHDTSLAPLSQGFTPAFSVGADFKWLLLPSLTLDGTINPDFGQVDADKVVLNLSSYETYFPEKRPFFLEAADVFATPMQLVYTRRIGRAPPLPSLPDRLDFSGTPDPSPIYGALKLSGNLGEAWSVGALFALSGASYAEARDVNDLHHTMNVLAEPLSSFQVLRLRRNFSGGSTLGVMATAVSRLEPTGEYPRVRPDQGGRLASLCPGAGPTGDAITVPLGHRCFHDAYLLSVDGKYRFFGGDYSIGAQAAASLIQGGPPRVQRDGNVIQSGDVSPGGKITAKKEGGGHLRAAINYEAHGKSFDYNDLGYMQRQNILSGDGYVEYDANGPWSRFNDGFIGAYGWDNETLDLLNVGRGGGLFMGVQFKNFWRTYFEINARANYQDDREIGDGSSLERGAAVELDFAVQTDERKPASIGLFTAQRFYPNGAFSLLVDSTIKARPLPPLEFELSPNFTYTRGEPRYVDTVAAADVGASGRDAYLFGKLEAASLSATLSGTYTFLPSLTLQVYGQAFMDFGHYSDIAMAAAVPGLKRNITFADLVPIQKLPDGENPDFVSGTFNANVVARWEYRLGSLLYLVYTHSQSTSRTPFLGEADRFQPRLVSPRAAADVFLLKASYWWG